ncbi:MAG TPA: isoaspartyl peptidase/L-asparaginase [Bacteroidales bacterium]|nr:isoaspartyl peptidase/L-asparaginase [Bacteroidales bacterium]HRZ47919.1 isoaspartyl peptidase/L-asparaginase [Bacteroidales bacterium]
MKKRYPVIIMVILLTGAVLVMANLRKKIPVSGPAPTRPEYVLVIHGGAGNITRESLPDSMAAEYYRELQTALVVGHRILDTGGTALDAVEAVVRFLEDCPLFNAGKGAVFTAEGKNELDASIMDGATGLAGAVAGVTTIKNPVSAARAVMEKSLHVMLAGRGAEAFARQMGLEMVAPEYFSTPDRYQSWKEAREKMDKKGTVGAVALDKKGNLAAATSTGGMMMKQWGRIGDSPVIGAGTFASNRTCAVSCTGHGEYFIRNAVAYDLSARMQYAGTPLRKGAHEILHVKLKEQGGTGGLIAIDKNGNFVMDFNTTGMFRGYLLPSGETKVMIFGDEK